MGLLSDLLSDQCILRYSATQRFAEQGLVPYPVTLWTQGQRGELGSQTWLIHPKTWQEWSKVFRYDIQLRNIIKTHWRDTEKIGKALCLESKEIPSEQFLRKILPGSKVLCLQPRKVAVVTDSFWYNAVSRICKKAVTHMSYTNCSLRATDIQKVSDTGLKLYWQQAYIRQRPLSLIPSV